MLTSQLKSLVEHGFVLREPIQGGQVRYSLTQTGQGFTHALLGVAAWAQQNSDQVEAALQKKYAG